MPIDEKKKLAFLKRMEKEREALALKAKKLEEFIQSDKFGSLNKQNQILLSQQLVLMVAYDAVLLKRISLNS